MIAAIAFAHPELQENEVFFTNSTKEEFNFFKYKTKRIGMVAYDSRGVKLNSKNYYPVFVNLSELKVAIQQARSVWRETVENYYKTA